MVWYTFIYDYFPLTWVYGLIKLFMMYHDNYIGNFCYESEKNYWTKLHFFYEWVNKQPNCSADSFVRIPSKTCQKWSLQIAEFVWVAEMVFVNKLFYANCTVSNAKRFPCEFLAVPILLTWNNTWQCLHRLLTHSKRYS